MKLAAKKDADSNTQSELLRMIEMMVVEAGIPPSEYIPALRRGLKSTADPQRALNNLHRFLAAGFATTLLRDFQAHNVLQSLYLELASQSQYLADILVRNPELFHWLTDTGELTRTKSTEDFLNEALSSIAPFERTEKRLDALKRFHRREMLRVGAREIVGEAEIPVVTSELSSLATAILECVVRISQEALSNQTGLTGDQTLAIIGLGKLGGNELNFSSDIDLMFVYDKDGDLPEPKERIHSLHQYYVRLCEFIVRGLSDHTGEGHLYRVDLRLRPDGRSGPLAMSRQAYVSYYESRGELWERQMLLKARVIAGNKDVGRQWQKDIRPFVSPKTFLRDPLEEIAAIKKKIERQLENDSDIKLGAGGIRDVEFIVQGLQLIRAGVDETVREGNTLDAIELLTTAGLLSATERKNLREAYVFFRRVEHRLQLLHGMQTHSLPQTAQEMRFLARRMQYTSSETFEREILRHQQRVKTLFNSVFQPKQSKDYPRPDYDAWLKSAVQTTPFVDKNEAQKNLDILFREFSDVQSTDFRDGILHSLRKYKAADWGLKNFLLFATVPALHRTLAQAVLKMETLDLLVLISSRSRRFSHLLSQEPILFESLVGRPEEMLSEDIGWGFLLPGDAFRFKLFNEFRIAVRALLGIVPIEKTTGELSALAAFILINVAKNVQREVEEPLTSQRDAILALGKLGGKEITIGSDLDLVFLYDRSKQGPSSGSPDLFAKKTLEGFSTVAGKMYEVDVRLRPEGKSAPLACEMNYLKEYFNDRASLWERQSLLKARVVYGDSEMTREIVLWCEHQVYKRRLPKKWNTEILSMRKRIEKERSKASKRFVDLKTMRGGLLDVEFGLQALQLCWGLARKKLRTGNSFEALRALESAGILPKKKVAALLSNYEYLRKLEFYVRLNSEMAGFLLPRNRSAALPLAAAVGERSVQNLYNRVARIRRENRILLLEIVRLCGES